MFRLIFIHVWLFRTLPSKNLQKVAEQFTKYNFQGLLVIGGFEVRPKIPTVLSKYSWEFYDQSIFTKMFREGFFFTQLGRNIKRN